MTWLFDPAGAGMALPEIFLTVSALALLMLGVFRERSHGLVTFLSLASIGATGLVIMLMDSTKSVAFGGAFVVDDFARILKMVTLFGSAVSIILATSFMRASGMERFEYPILVLLATTGMMMMISANGLIALYMGLELQSLALYVVASFDRQSSRSSEAGLKYFVLGALSSGMLLYGASLIYGTTGQTNFPEIAEAIGTHGGSLGLLVGLVFLISGLAFKVSAVPFHMWTPDVYEGSPTPVTAFFAAAPKIAAMAMFVRAMVEPFPTVDADWQQIIVFISIASMILGAFAAIGQSNIKRLLAYSSIGHMGYALVGLASNSEEGVRGVVIYMILYMIMTLGAFACVLAMRRSGRQLEDIGDLAGLARNDRLLAFVLAALMFSLAGIPPLAGFFGKYFVFMAAIKSGLLLLAIVGVVASVIGAYYYLRIVKIMYFDDPAPVFEGVSGEVRVVAVLSGLFTVLFVVIAQPIVDLASTAAAALY